MSYFIEMTCWDKGCKNPYKDYVEDIVGTGKRIFSSKAEALNILLMCVIEEADLLSYDEEEGVDISERKHFRIDLNSEHDAIIRAWDGDDYKNVTAYNIVEL